MASARVRSGQAGAGRADPTTLEQTLQPTPAEAWARKEAARACGHGRRGGGGRRRSCTGPRPPAAASTLHRASVPPPGRRRVRVLESLLWAREPGSHSPHKSYPIRQSRGASKPDPAPRALCWRRARGVGFQIGTEGPHGLMWQIATELMDGTLFFKQLSLSPPRLARPAGQQTQPRSRRAPPPIQCSQPPPPTTAHTSPSLPCRCPPPPDAAHRAARRS